MSTTTNPPPVHFFAKALHNSCTIKLNDGTTVTGKLSLIDGLMNLVLEEATEEINGQKTTDDPECFIRGNNGLFTQLQE